MSRYVLTPAADRDVRDIVAYIAEQSGMAAADRLDEELHTAMGRLAETPGLGHVRADLADASLRTYAVHRYLIFYLPDEKPLQVLRVLHGARDVRALLDEGE
jgi:toxin ParE1/3/4